MAVQFFTLYLNVFCKIFNVINIRFPIFKNLFMLYLHKKLQIVYSAVICARIKDLVPEHTQNSNTTNVVYVEFNLEQEISMIFFMTITLHKGFSLLSWKKRSTLRPLNAELIYRAFYSYLVGCMSSYLMQ